MDDTAALRARMVAIEADIRHAQEKLSLNKVLHKDHQATRDELFRRYQMLDRQLDNEIIDLRSKLLMVDSLGKTVLNWINGFDFDR